MNESKTFGYIFLWLHFFQGWNISGLRFGVRHAPRQIGLPCLPQLWGLPSGYLSRPPTSFCHTHTGQSLLQIREIDSYCPPKDTNV